MKRRALLVAALVAAQALVVGVYLLVERGRAAPAEPLAFERLDQPLPPLILRRPGETRRLPDEGTQLLHLWATWCEPCREELPILLDVELPGGVELIAASVDETWPVIQHYFTLVPASVWRVEEGEEALPADTLPTTLVVEDGRVLARLVGPQRWTEANVERLLRR